MRRMVFILVALNIVSSVLFAKTWVVDTTGYEGDSLQIAVDSAWQDPGIDTVLVKDGTYHLAINGDTGLIMHDSVVLISENGAQKCTLTAISEDATDTAYHVIYCSDWDTASHAALIKGFTIMNGNARDTVSPHCHGGGIYIYRASPKIDSCIITNNSAGYGGGGIFIYGYSSPSLTSNTISGNFAERHGGGIFIGYYSSPSLTNNTISNNSVNYYGGGIYIYNYSSPSLTDNTISGNSAGYHGGGICIYGYSSPSLTSNTISDNSTEYRGGGIFIYYYSSPSLTRNTISDNAAAYGGGVCIRYYSSPSLTSNTISDNSTEYRGGGIFISQYSSVTFVKCVIGMNKSYYKGGAIYDTLCSKVIIDSSFIVDNGDRVNHQSGLAYITSDADSGVTFKIAHSHIYYNTFQPDTEIYNLSSVTIPLENNFWWDTTDAEISSKIYGPNDHEPWVNDFIGGVPGEPVSIDSIRNYDKDFATVVDSIGGEDTLYIRVYGQDRNNHIREIAVVIIKSSVYPEGIACGLVETDTNSGIYQGVAYVRESTGNDTIRVDDIEQTIRVNPSGDTISLIGNTDTTKKFHIEYKKGGPVAMQEVLPKVFAVSVSPNLLRDFTVIKYQMPQKERVILKILDITGRVVNTLVDEIKEPGYYSVVWRGKDTNGRDLPSGIYFYAIEAGKNRVFGKIIRLK